jgi:hypothetical protein
MSLSEACSFAALSTRDHSHTGHRTRTRDLAFHQPLSKEAHDIGLAIGARDQVGGVALEYGASSVDAEPCIVSEPCIISEPCVVSGSGWTPDGIKTGRLPTNDVFAAMLFLIGRDTVKSKLDLGLPRLDDCSCEGM